MNTYKSLVIALDTVNSKSMLHIILFFLKSLVFLEEYIWFVAPFICTGKISAWLYGHPCYCQSDYTLSSENFPPLPYISL